MEQSQMNSQIRIFMDHIHKHFTHVQRDSQFLLTFPDECLFFGFALFDFAANKLPQQPSGLMSRTLAYQKLVFVPNQGRYYLCHLSHHQFICLSQKLRWDRTIQLPDNIHRFAARMLHIVGST